MPSVSLPILDEEPSTCSKSSDTDFQPCQSKGVPHLITQKDLNDLVRDLNLSKSKNELLRLRLFYSLFYLFYLYIYPPDSQESDVGANT